MNERERDREIATKLAQFSRHQRVLNSLNHFKLFFANSCLEGFSKSGLYTNLHNP